VIGKVEVLKDRIRNLNELHTHCIRISERGIGRVVSNEIIKSEKELRILKVQMNNNRESI
jgi:hypothetical protein